MTHPAPDPVSAFMATLSDTAPDAPTACTLWTAHEVTAHLAAALEETAELVEDVLNERPNRPTRGFDERESPFRALPDDELRTTLVAMITRANLALEALAALGSDASFQFFGRPFTAAQLQTHAASEFSLHRWDLCGDDEIGDVLLSAPALTLHAVDVLNTLPMLDEAPGSRIKASGLENITVVLRSPGLPDVALVAGDGEGHFVHGTNEPLTGDVVLETDAVNRLLTLWGRYSTPRPLRAIGDQRLLPAVSGALWGGGRSAPFTIDGAHSIRGPHRTQPAVGR